ncbi:hypothetical protein [Natrononativus amylolyticus]|uniref:hypothetical protein n=1 Tax=Natrononativus amylolyticus TaxID=2963434 RepID=UPI0020CBEC3F|nr:hypothetical protein [Natrononativus amylolyticus]
MTGDGDSRDDGSDDSDGSGAGFDVPSVLAQLDAGDDSTRLEGARAVSRMIDDDPARAVPTVPKLRSLLEDGSPEHRALAADSLAELAVESVDDVAPSADAIAAFVCTELRTDGSPRATADALRCLAAIASERPGAVADHADDVAAALEATEQSTEWGRETLAAVEEARADRTEVGQDREQSTWRETSPGLEVDR